MTITTCNPPVKRIISVAACLLSAIAIIVTVTIPGCADQKEQAAGLVRAAIEHSEADRHTDAVQLLNRAIALNPALAEAFYLRGTCFGKMLQTQKAVDDFSAATRLKADWDEAWCALGIAQMTSGETAAGIASLTRALQLNSQMLPARIARIQGYRDLRRTDEELHDINALLQVDATNGEALLRRGMLLSETNPAQATEDLSGVIRRDRNNASAWMQRGLCYSRTGDTDRALADLNIACRLRADDFRPWLERGRILRTLNRAGDAISDLSKAAELAPHEFITRLELGRACLSTANIDAAEAHLLEAERLSPNDGELRMALAQTDLARGRNESALERLRSLLAEENSLSPSLQAAARIRVAELLLRANKTDDAMSHVDEVLAAEPADTDARRIRAALLAKSDRRAEAIEDYTRLISSGASLKTEEMAQSVLDRGRLHLESSDWSAATADFSTYLEVHPDHAETLILRARASLAQNEAGKAIGDLTLALLKKPDDADVYTLRAEAFDQFNEPAAALADLQKAAILQPHNPDLHEKVAERLFHDRQFAKSAKILDMLAASNAGHLSTTQQLLRGRARLADGNVIGADEDACAVAAAESTSSGAVTSDDAILLQSMIALHRHDDVEALRLIRNIPEETLTPETLLLYGQTLARQKHADEAIRILTTLTESDPSNTTALISRAGVFLETADWQAALNDAGLVLRHMPDHPRALEIRGISLFQNDRFREALETLEHPALLSRDTNAARWIRIQCCDVLEMTFREMEELNALLEIAPTHEGARLLRAELLEKLGHFDAAIADLSVALQQNPENLTAMIDRALLSQRRGNAAQAVIDFTKAVELSPNDAELYYRRGIARHQAGQSDAARQDLDKALELNSRLADAWYVIGNIEAGRGQSDVALAAYAKAVEIKPEHAAAWYNRGNLLFNQSKLQQAIDCWTISITIQPELFRAYNNRAAAYSRLGHDADAAADYEKTLQLNPAFARAWDNLAWLLATSDNTKVRDPQRAVQLATKACELSAFKDWASLNTLATCCAENQEFDAAVKWARQARALAPETDRKELDQLVAAYEARLKSRRLTEKPGRNVR